MRINFDNHTPQFTEDPDKNLKNTMDMKLKVFQISLDKTVLFDNRKAIDRVCLVRYLFSFRDIFHFHYKKIRECISIILFILQSTLTACKYKTSSPQFWKELKLNWITALQESIAPLEQSTKQMYWQAQQSPFLWSKRMKLCFSI